MRLRPQRSTLFPYTTLFRSEPGTSRISTTTRERRPLRTMPRWTISAITRGSMFPPPSTSPTRSEEHTSELQSQFHLVCRLLLEKKKHIMALQLIHLVKHLER